MLAIEKKQREEAEEAMLEMLKDIVQRMKQDIDTEKREREGTEEMLLNLLEDTCTKLNSAARS